MVLGSVIYNTSWFHNFITLYYIHFKAILLTLSIYHKLLFLCSPLNFDTDSILGISISMMFWFFWRYCYIVLIFSKFTNIFPIMPLKLMIYIGTLNAVFHIYAL